MSSNKTDTGSLNIVDVLAKMQESMDRIEKKQDNSTSVILNSLEDHDSSSSFDHKVMMDNLFNLKKQNEELNTKISYLKNEVKSNSSIKRTMTTALAFFIFFNLVIILKYFSNYNLDIVPWYKFGVLISLIILVISFLINKDLKNVD